MPGEGILKLLFAIYNGIPALFSSAIQSPHQRPRIVDRASIMPKPTFPPDVFPIVTPLLADKWEEALRACGPSVWSRFSDIPRGLRNGFRLGVHSRISSTFMPPNHKSAFDNAEFVSEQIEKEIAAGRYSSPFDPSTLESLFGPFRTSPLGVVFHPVSDKPRLVQDHSFPHNDPSVSSINSEIDPSSFPCDWDLFSDCLLLVARAPPGAEAAVFDVDAAHRRMPVSPKDRLHVCIHWHGKVYVDHCCSFGCSSSSGIFGHCADGMACIYRSNGIQDLVKWADDFVFFRYPIRSNNRNRHVFPYDATLIWDIAEDLGWPWAENKFIDFSSSFPYLGFFWNLVSKTVSLPEDKKSKYLALLAPWTPRASVSRHDCQVLIGTLNHAAIVLDGAPSRLPALYDFSASFHDSPPFVRRRIPKTVLADIAWWHEQLSSPLSSRKIFIPPPPLPSPIFVDASLWGIGFVHGDRGLAWRLSPGWKSDGRDIGWAEMVAIELALLAVVAAGFRRVHFIVHSDNQGVIGALASGRSRNPQQNFVLRRIVSGFLEHRIWFSVSYIPSAENPADPPSHGIFPPFLRNFAFTPSLPNPLRPFIFSVPIPSHTHRC